MARAGQAKCTQVQRLTSESTLNPDRRGRLDLFMHAAMAIALTDNPDVVLNKVRSNIERTATVRGEDLYVWRWRLLLELPPEELALRLVEPSRTMTELRAHTPWHGVLSGFELATLTEQFLLDEGDPPMVASFMRRVVELSHELRLAAEDPIDLDKIDTFRRRLGLET